MKYLVPILFLVLFSQGCSNEELFIEDARRDLWLIHEGAKLPIVVEGNTQSKVFVILLHGGPGGTAQDYNAGAKPFTDVLESDYAMVYYDQRNAGLAVGEWNEEKLTIEQHVEDLDKVIDLLLQEYDNDIQLFLAGHSWGGYLGTAFLLESERAARVQAWININGLVHRNRNLFDVIERVEQIGSEQITEGVNEDQWQSVLETVNLEKDRGIVQYDVDSEDSVFDLIRQAENQIDRDKVLDNIFSSEFSAIYNDNYDPFRILQTDTKSRDRTLRSQMYLFDLIIEEAVENITLPTLNIYGYYDVNTPLQQGEYLFNEIGTLDEDKKIVVLGKSGHSSMRNEPVELANEMIEWIEKYKR